MPTGAESSTERTTTGACVLTGLAVAIALAPKEGLVALLGNAAFLWLPQAIALAVLALFSRRYAAVSGTALILALYLFAFHTWVFAHSRPDSMAWLGYLFSLPGATAGAICGGIYIKHRNVQHAITAGILVAIFTLAGLALNQFVICSTVMYCG